MRIKKKRIKIVIRSSDLAEIKQLKKILLQNPMPLTRAAELATVSHKSMYNWIEKGSGDRFVVLVAINAIAKSKKNQRCNNES